MENKEQMKLLRQQGLNYAQIAKACGVSRQYVAQVLGGYDPYRFIPVSEKCIYPNLRKWMNDNKVSCKEFLRRMGYATTEGNTYYKFRGCIMGEIQPTKPYIDKMLKVTGLTYEVLFYEGKKYGK